MRGGIKYGRDHVRLLHWMDRAESLVALHSFPPACPVNHRLPTCEPCTDIDARRIAGGLTVVVGLTCKVRMG